MRALKSISFDSSTSRSKRYTGVRETRQPHCGVSAITINLFTLYHFVTEIYTYADLHLGAPIGRFWFVALNAY